MAKSSKLFNLFEFTDKLQKKIVSSSDFTSKHKYAYLFILASTFIVASIAAFNRINIIIGVLGIFIIIETSLGFFLKMFSSLKAFVFGSFVLSVLVSLILYNLIFNCTENRMLNYIIVVVFFCLCWIFISLIADNKIATLTNEIYSIFFAIIIIIKDSVIEILNYFEIDLPNDTAIFFSIIFAPLLVTNSLATLLCLIKAYWADKKTNLIIKTDELETKISELDKKEK